MPKSDNHIEFYEIKFIKENSHSKQVIIHHLSEEKNSFKLNMDDMIVL